MPADPPLPAQSACKTGHGRKARPRIPNPPNLPVATTSPQPSTLRLYTEPAARAAKSAGAPWPACPKCCRPSSEQRAGRCNMRPDRCRRLPTRNRRPNRVGPQPVNPGPGTSPGHLTLSARRRRSEDPSPRSPFEAARGLASAIGGMLEEILQLRRALVEREAELAAGVPLVPHPEEPEHLANRLEAVLARRGPGRWLPCGSLVPSRRGNQQAQVTVLLGTAFGSAHGATATLAGRRGRSGINAGARGRAGRHGR